jgi:nitroimidazol reductase NimA-like FMN-containing flavoprotein (pyridoxamine 5'-phosphate oxidase superfamily)
VVNSILDEGIVAHVGFAPQGQPMVLPMAYARVDDQLYLHGATANHMLRYLAGGAEVCVTVTLVDALVLARSAFHHSINYRCVVLVGTTTPVVDEQQKAAALEALIEHLVPGRTRDARPPTPAELKATLVVRLPIVEGSAKIRTGPPVEEEADLLLPIWAGEIPLSVTFGAPTPDHRLAPIIQTPTYITNIKPDR